MQSVRIWKDTQQTGTSRLGDKSGIMGSDRREFNHAYIFLGKKRYVCIV